MFTLISMLLELRKNTVVWLAIFQTKTNNFEAMTNEVS